MFWFNVLVKYVVIGVNDCFGFGLFLIGWLRWE